MLVGHKHVTVNGKRVNRTGYQVGEGDEIEISDEKAMAIVRANAAEVGKSRSVPDWLEAEPDKGKVRVVRMPNRDDVPEPFEEQLVVEFYGR